MIDLTFVGNDHPNGIGVDPFVSVGTIDYGQHGWFDYFSFTGANVVNAPISVFDGLYNPSAQLIGNVYVQNDQQLNGTLGMFVFYPNGGFNSTVSQVFVNSTYPRVDMTNGVPETSTMLMLLIGFAALFLPGAWRKRAAVRT